MQPDPLGSVRLGTLKAAQARAFGETVDVQTFGAATVVTCAAFPTAMSLNRAYDAADGRVKDATANLDRVRSDGARISQQMASR